MKKLLLPTCLLVAVSLAACGGGDGTAPPVDTATATLGADLIAPIDTSELAAELIPDNTVTSVPGNELMPPG